ncbi:MAG: flagellar basal-body rod protein FlgG [Anaerolineae bacterium]|nr:flagellar basal-body rod protein FlgG [Anaerolineae bacterium]
MPSFSLTSLLHLARSGILSQQTGIDITSNNIANVNTVGYKRARAEFNELLSAELAPALAGSGRSSGQAAGIRLADNQRIFSQGQIEYTGYAWDMAIEGEGFFQVQQPDGSLAYTRDGNFRLDGEGQLTDSRGYLVAPGVVIPPDAEDTFVNTDGTVMIRRRGELEPQSLTTITLARFSNPSGLDKIGENLFVPSDASGQPQVEQATANGTGQILSRTLEDSNVDLSREVVNLITGQRAYSMMVRALQTSDEMLSLANQLR